MHGDGHDEKVFCIGCNKTGTSSLLEAVEQLGFRFGSLEAGERLARSYLAGDFAPIIEFARSADAFKDVPFSLPGTFLHLDAAFPRAKFILTVRDSTEQWYSSLTRAHSALLSPGELPTATMLKACGYSYPGFMWDVQCLVIGTQEAPYDRATLFGYYERHNAAIREHFRGREDFLEINIAEPDSYPRLCEFLEKPLGAGFPWLNRTPP